MTSVSGRRRDPDPPARRIPFTLFSLPAPQPWSKCYIRIAWMPLEQPKEIPRDISPCHVTVAACTPPRHFVFIQSRRSWHLVLGKFTATSNAGHRKAITRRASSVNYRRISPGLSTRGDTLANT